jgi:multiple sugar transport system ATP-binding protein
VPSITLQNISKAFSQPRRTDAISNLSLNVGENEFLVLVGPSGCGKTTLLRVIAGLEKPDSGKVLFDRTDITNLAAKDRDVAMVFQTPALLPHLTAFDNIGFGLKLRHVPKGEIEKKVRAAAEMLGLNDKLTNKPAELSGGEAQRVALGRAIVREPKILLLDEPLSQLDAPTRKQLRREIVCLHERLKIPAIYVTHDQREALKMGKRIAVMNAGQLRQIGTTEDIQHRPGCQFIADFFEQD